MIPEEVAQYLRVSMSWVYQNWQVLGGVKIGGKIFFPNQRDLYEHIFYQRERMEVRVRGKQKATQQSVVSDKIRGKKGVSKTQRGNNKSKTENQRADRHNIWGSGGKPVGLCESL